LGVSLDNKAAWSADDQAAMYLVVTNTSDSLCSVTGYPVVVPYDTTGHEISVTYEQGSFGDVPIADPSIYRTPLIPGENAYAGVTWATRAGPNCSSAGQFHVTLPGTGASPTAIPVVTEICMIGANRGPFAVTAIGPGESFMSNQYQP
jgi:Protein of unknown function (DUF4232)